MDSKIYIPYIPVKQALYSDKVDRLGYIWGDKKRGEGLTSEEWIRNMESAHNAQSSRNIDMYLSGGYDVSYLNKKYGVLEYREQHADNTKYEYYEVSCPILNQVKNPIQGFELIKCRMENLMFVLFVDIPIQTIDSDIESELRFWVRDSMEINIHHEIPENERLKMLPTKDLKIKVGDVDGTLVKCRVVDFQKPFRIALLVEKIK